MRVFIAIEFDDSVKRFLKDVQDVVKATSISGDFTHYSNFHLTIKYIGTIYNGDYDELCQCIEDAAEKMAPFSIRIGDIGAFTSKTSSIIWVGITKGKHHLKQLFDYVESEVTQSGFAKEERKYKPHITIGKKVVFDNGHFTNELPFYQKDIPCTKLTLFESHRVDGVLTYTPLYRVPLKTNDIKE